MASSAPQENSRSLSDILTGLQNGVVAISNLWQAIQTVTASSSSVAGIATSGSIVIRLTQVST